MSDTSDHNKFNENRALSHLYRAAVRRAWDRLSAAVLMSLLLPAAVMAAEAVPASKPLWSVSLATAAGAGPIYANQTIRQIVHLSAAGSSLRLRMSHRYGADAIGLTAVSIGIVDQGAAIRPETLRPVSFGGQRIVSLGGGQTLTSDPIPLLVGQFEDLAISFTVASYVNQISRHATARERVFMSKARDAADDASDSSYRPVIGANNASYLLIEAVEAEAPVAPRTLVAVGDSITDGYVSANGSTLNEDMTRLGRNERYPDFLARRLAQAYPGTYAVVNAGISGNRVTLPAKLPAYGSALLNRLDRDVLEVHGVTDVILMEGINDLGSPGSGKKADPDALIAALSVAVVRLRAANLRVLLGTLLPVRSSPGGMPGLKGASSNLYDTPEVEAARLQVNAWIRKQTLADAVVDFDACLRNPLLPEQLQSAYDSGDHLHPSPAGYRAMAECVDLGLLRQ